MSGLSGIASQRSLSNSPVKIFYNSRQDNQRSRWQRPGFKAPVLHLSTLTKPRPERLKKIFLGDSPPPPSQGLDDQTPLSPYLKVWICLWRPFDLPRLVRKSQFIQEDRGASAHRVSFKVMQLLIWKFRILELHVRLIFGLFF